MNELREGSVTRSPAFEDAKILGVGQEAANTWQMLTERRSVTRCR
jgi:hypothetical protein